MLKPLAVIVDLAGIPNCHPPDHIPIARTSSEVYKHLHPNHIIQADVLAEWLTRCPAIDQIEVRHFLRERVFESHSRRSFAFAIQETCLISGLDVNGYLQAVEQEQHFEIVGCGSDETGHGDMDWGVDEYECELWKKGAATLVQTAVYVN